ncbi:integrase arm-type DNA-binding domain-containing protein [Rhodopseudomonas palustris]|nr:integrase arm-type DNA-binding domain-containing protein [Rhodopseudomonas palustris]
MSKGLTPVTVRNAKPGAARREVPDGGCRGLYLVIQPSGGKSWVFRYRASGASRKLTIGPVYIGDDEPGSVALGRPVTLAGARKLAGEAALQVAKGADPAGERVRDRKSAREIAERDTVEAVARRFVLEHGKARNRSWVPTARLIGLAPDKNDPTKLIRVKGGGEILSRWGHRPIREITRRDVNDLLRAIVVRGSPITSNRVLAHVRKMFNWAVGEDIIPTSPCIGVTRKADETPRSRYLRDDELRLVWQAAGALEYPWRQFFRLLILTMQRRNEVAGIRRSEIRADDRLWIIPADRAKNGIEHEVPLSDAAMAILESCPEIGREGFFLTRYGAAGLSGFSKAKIEIDAAILTIQRTEAVASGENPDAVTPLENWTLHDLRRTGSTGLAALEVDIVVAEKLLNHKSGSLRGVVGTYNRHHYSDKKRAAMEAWTAHVLKVANG